MLCKQYHCFHSLLGSNIAAALKAINSTSQLSLQSHGDSIKLKKQGKHYIVAYSELLILSLYNSRGKISSVSADSSSEDLH